MKWDSRARNEKSMSPDSAEVPAWADLYTTTASLLAGQDSAILFFCEGTGQSGQAGTSHGKNPHLIMPSQLSTIVVQWCTTIFWK